MRVKPKTFYHLKTIVKRKNWKTKQKIAIKF